MERSTLPTRIIGVVGLVGAAYMAYSTYGFLKRTASAIAGLDELAQNCTRTVFERLIACEGGACAQYNLSLADAANVGLENINTTELFSFCEYVNSERAVYFNGTYDVVSLAAVTLTAMLAFNLCFSCAPKSLLNKEIHIFSRRPSSKDQ